MLMVGAGILNMLLNYVMIVPLQMGIAGAALATGIGQCIPAVLGLGFFTALSNGKVSALMSFSRTLVFIVISLLILPRIFGIVGAWIAVPVTEFLTLMISGWMHRKYFLMPGKLNYLGKL